MCWRFRSQPPITCNEFGPDSRELHDGLRLDRTRWFLDSLTTLLKVRLLVIMTGSWGYLLPETRS